MHACLARYRRAMVLLAVFGVLVLVPRLLPKPPLAALSPSSTAVYARNGELLRLTLAKDQQYRLPLPLQAIPPTLQQATLLYEDRWFYQHFGINPYALLRAIVQTYGRGTRQGASTITMQLARQLYHINSRQPLGKLWQCLAALWLEWRYRKDELLAAYLNTAPYGGNISGVGAASLIYFHKPASQLSLSEALTLAVVPQNPIRRAPAMPLPPALAQARQRLWQRWLQRHPEDQRFAVDMQLPMQVYRRADKPFIAPHLTDGLLRHYPNDTQIISSIDLGVQNAIKHQVDSLTVQQRTSGIRNAAVLMVDADTMAVTALVGSANFWDKAIAGQVNGVLAKRSPGSTLKPFVYALALEQGLLHPRTVLKDTPTRFGAFNPENFDGRFMGPVSAQDALVRSRNIPALTLAGQLKRPNLYEFLSLAGISGLAPEAHYGLTLSLGSAEVTMEELAKLYALLANQGRLRPLSYRADRSTDTAPHTPLLSAASAFITLDMLSHNARPDTKRPAIPWVAWKTGTSWGFKDAWAVGVVGRSVLVVWVGNFDNASNTAFIGIQTAAPLFFNIVDSLRAQGLWPGLAQLPTPPGSVRELEVCAASGDLPNPDCPVRVKTWFIPGVSPIKTSTLHRAVYVDNSNGQVVCKDQPNSHKEVYEFWDSDMLGLFQAAGMPRRVPPLLPPCYAPLAGTTGGLAIVSPATVGAYRISLSKPASLALRAHSQSGQPIYWFANKSYLGTSKPSETLAWQPTRAGRYTLRAVDALGVADVREVTVEIAP